MMIFYNKDNEGSFKFLCIFIQKGSCCGSTTQNSEEIVFRSPTTKLSTDSPSRTSFNNSGFIDKPSKITQNQRISAVIPSVSIHTKSDTDAWPKYLPLSKHMDHEVFI